MVIYGIPKGNPSLRLLRIRAPGFSAINIINKLNYDILKLSQQIYLHNLLLFSKIYFYLSTWTNYFFLLFNILHFSFLFSPSVPISVSCCLKHLTRNLKKKHGENKNMIKTSESENSKTITCKHSDFIWNFLSFLN